MASSGRKTALFIRAEKLRLARDFEEAIPAFVAVLHEDPEDLHVRRTLAGLYLMHGDPRREAVGSLLLATGLLSQRRLDEAEAMAARAERLGGARLGAPVRFIAERLADARTDWAADLAAALSLDALDEALRIAADPREEEATVEIEEAALEPEILAETRLQEGTTDWRPAGEIEIEIDAAEAACDLILQDAERGASDGSRSFAFLSTALFAKLPPEALRELVAVCQKVTVPLGTAVFLEGCESDSVLVLAEGRAVARTVADDGRTVTIAEYGPGEPLGLMAFLASTQDTTIVAETECLCYRLSFDDMERLMADHTDFGMAVIEAHRERVIDLFLRTFLPFSTLPETAHADLARSLELLTANVEEPVQAGGDHEGDLYIIQAGAVRVMGESPEGQREIALLGKHEVFDASWRAGEVAAASFVAASQSQLLRLPAESRRAMEAAFPALGDAFRRQ